MKCPKCNHPEGIYTEVEDFNPGSEYEWSYSYYWQCFNCNHYVSDFDDKFEYPEDY